MLNNDSNSIVLDLSKAEGSILVDAEIIKSTAFSPESIVSLPRRDAYTQLKGSIAQFYGTAAGGVVLGNGSDELIDHITRAKQGKVSLTLTPSFERLFEVNEKFGYEANTYSLPVENGYEYTDNFHADILSEIKRTAPDLIWLCSPDNPTGTIIKPKYIHDIAAKFPESWVIIDIAFIDILNDEMIRGYTELVRTQNNVIVLGSFSKSWGIAALRIGFLLAPVTVAQTIARQSVMFNVNGIAVEIAQKCMDGHEYRLGEFGRIHEHLDGIRKVVSLMPQYELIANSNISVFCLRLRSALDLHDRLLSAGIKTKSLHKMPGMENMGFCRILVPRESSDVKTLLEKLSVIS